MSWSYVLWITCNTVRIFSKCKILLWYWWILQRSLLNEASYKQLRLKDSLFMFREKMVTFYLNYQQKIIRTWSKHLCSDVPHKWKHILPSIATMLGLLACSHTTNNINQSCNIVVICYNDMWHWHTHSWRHSDDSYDPSIRESPFKLQMSKFASACCTCSKFGRMQLECPSTITQPPIWATSLKDVIHGKIVMSSTNEIGKVVRYFNKMERKLEKAERKDTLIIIKIKWNSKPPIIENESNYGWFYETKRQVKTQKYFMERNVTRALQKFSFNLIDYTSKLIWSLNSGGKE